MSMRRSRCRGGPIACAGSANSGRGMRVSSRTDGGALTSEQRKAFGRYRARWAAIRRSTEPAARGSAEQGVRLAYRAAGLEPPERVVWCDSPVAMSRRALRISRSDGANVRWELVDRLRRKVGAAVKRRLSPGLLGEVQAAVSPADALAVSVADVVTEAATLDPVPLYTRFRRGEPLSPNSVMLALRGRDGFRHAAAGPHDLSWLAALEYVRGVL